MEIWRSHVLVCAGAGCVSSGCREVRDALVQGITEFGLQSEIKVIETGCIGSCDLGPIVVIYPEGVFYQKLKPADARLIAEEHLFKGRVVERLLYTEPATTKLIPTFKEIDFFKLQEKVVLRNCGLIDPLNIEEYIAREGYEALAQALNRMTPAGSRGRHAEIGAPGKGRGRVPHRDQVEVYPAGEGQPQVRGLQRRRGRPGGFHGPERFGRRPPQRHRSDDHRGLRHRLQPGLCLREGRISPGDRAAEPRHRAGAGIQVPGKEYLREAF